jgi:hypothetical protein
MALKAYFQRSISIIQKPGGSYIYLKLAVFFVHIFEFYLVPFTAVYFLFASLKLLTEILLRIPFSVIGRCSLLPTSHWLQRICARINLSQAALCIILQNHRRLPVSIFSVKIAALGSLNLQFFTFSTIKKQKIGKHY